MYKVYVVIVMFTSQESEILFIWNCTCAYTLEQPIFWTKVHSNLILLDLFVMKKQWISSPCPKNVKLWKWHELVYNQDTFQVSKKKNSN